MRTTENGIIAVTIQQTETFTIYVKVPKEATVADIMDMAHRFHDHDEVLEYAYGNGDCTTKIMAVKEATPSLGTFVHTLTEDGDLEAERIV